MSDLDTLITTAVTRLITEMETDAPRLAAHVRPWLTQLAGGKTPDQYFKPIIAFPILRFTEWAAQSLTLTPDPAFQADLIYSTISGYYYIRLLDNLMDGHGTTELQFLPVAGFFHTQFQSTYQAYFAATHPFWGFFKKTWFQSAEVTVADAHVEALTRDAFEHVSGLKVCAGKIPLAALCHYYHREDRLTDWLHFHDALGAWHQMFNDVYDWSKDLRFHTTTYFLSEAARRKQATESVAAWVAREGFAWGVADLHTRMQNLLALAEGLGSPALIAYLHQRDELIQTESVELLQSLRTLAALEALLPPKT